MSGIPSNRIRDANEARKRRPPIGKKAMTATERQRRRRKRLAKVKSITVKKRLRARNKQQNAALYNPTPPGITYWRYRVGRLADGTLVKIAAPETKPLAACRRDLDAGDILALIRRLSTMARDMGLADAAKEAFSAGTISRKDLIDAENFAAGITVYRDERGSRNGGWTCWGDEAAWRRTEVQPRTDAEGIASHSCNRGNRGACRFDPCQSPRPAIRDNRRHEASIRRHHQRDAWAERGYCGHQSRMAQGVLPAGTVRAPATGASARSPTEEIKGLAAKVLTREEQHYFAEEMHYQRGRISVATFEYIKAVEIERAQHIVTPACHEISDETPPAQAEAAE
jgi:hypothetical protein